MTLHNRLQSAADDTRNRIGELNPPPLPGRRPWLAIAVAITAIVAVGIGIGNLGGGIAPTQTISPPSSIVTRLPTSVYPVARYIPNGWELVASHFGFGAGHAYYVPAGLDAVIGAETFMSVHNFNEPESGFTFEAVMSAFEAADLDATQTTVRGQPAAVSVQPSGDAVLVILEDDATFTEIDARNVDLDELTAIGESLSFVSQKDFQADRLDRITWDLSVAVSSTEEPNSVIRYLQELPGIADVRLLYNAPVFPRVYPFLLANDGAPATTKANSSSASNSEQASAVSSFDALILLEAGVDPDEIAALLVDNDIVYGVEFSPGITMQIREHFDALIASGTTVQADPPVVQAPPSPEADFDTSALGTEVPLSPAKPGDELSVPDTLLSELSGDSGYAIGSVVHLGVLDDGTRLYAQFLEFDLHYLTLVTEDGSGSSGGDLFSYYRYGVVGSSMLGSGRSFIDVKVPLDAAVVVLKHGGEILWQRPVLGYGVFPVATPTGTAEVIAFDSTGRELGRWEG